MDQYDHKKIEKKWQKRWEESQQYQTDTNKVSGENYFLLVEYPYPSGNLHIGHWYAFAVPDILARKKRMEGKNVLYPIGFDSFGLPAENAAIKRNLDPRKWTNENIAYMIGQLQSMGNSFDWSRVVVASEPDYYKWTQWIFLQFFKQGLAYKDTDTANWCPQDKTVLANEQVVDGKCERCGAIVEQREVASWYFKITEYAERLLEGLEKVNWPEEIKQSQRNWIGKSEGAELTFHITNFKFQTNSESQDATFQSEVKVFTTRPDTLFGATYLVLAPEHALVNEWIENGAIKNAAEVSAYITSAKQQTEIERTKEGGEKTGVKLEGITAINPANKEEIPVFIADYVLAEYGTGAIMAVPAHDARDFAFAKKFDLKIKQVIEVNYTVTEGGNAREINNNISDAVAKGEDFYIDTGQLLNSGQFNGLWNSDAKKKITEFVGGEMKATYRLRDWSLSRQRYWGCPIPIVYDPEGKAHAIPDEHLPWTLPNDVDFTPTGKAPLASSKELFERVETIFGKGWTPEVDTFDTFVDSSWYFLRYLDPKNEKEFSPLALQKKWMPIARYSGGAEHTTLHVLYSRFFYKALFDLGLVANPQNLDEPYLVRMNRGTILGPDGNKMSKSKGNVIDPDELVGHVGADAVKLYLAFIGPYNETGSYPWDPNGVVGSKRFLEKVWRLQEKVAKEAVDSEDLTRLIHATIKKVGEDVEVMKFNTAIAQLMMLANAFDEHAEISKHAYETLLCLLAPFAPHTTEELWEGLGNNVDGANSIHAQPWPKFDEQKLEKKHVRIVIQINGKVRANGDMHVQASKEELERFAREHPKIIAWLAKRTVKKVVVVPNKVVNFVTEQDEDEKL